MAGPHSVARAGAQLKGLRRAARAAVGAAPHRAAHLSPAGHAHAGRRAASCVIARASMKAADSDTDRLEELESASLGPEAASAALPKLMIQGRQLKVTDAIRARVEKEVAMAAEHFNAHQGRQSIKHIDVRLSARGGPTHQTKGPQLHKAEVTVFTTIGVVRSEVELDNMYQAIAGAASKVERKLRKLKEKAVTKGVWKGHGTRASKKEKNASKWSDAEALDDVAWDSYVEELDYSNQRMTLADQQLKIHRRKQIDLVPMTVEDAVESLQFLGHDFFLFLDKHTGQVSLVYKRDVEGYGVLAPNPPDA